MKQGWLDIAHLCPTLPSWATHLCQVPRATMRILEGEKPSGQHLRGPYEGLIVVFQFTAGCYARRLESTVWTRVMSGAEVLEACMALHLQGRGQAEGRCR